jgi:hypothetical protein
MVQILDKYGNTSTYNTSIVILNKYGVIKNYINY